MIFPWQAQQWQTLKQAQLAERLPHALLLSGPEGMGKATFADEWSRVMLCQAVTDGMPCHACHACRLIEGRAHPNVRWIEPEKSGSAIKVDQIREANEFISQSGLQGDSRIVVIHPADCLNVNAANALLKTLEEPSAGALMLLVCHQSERLPATILSRCQRIVFTRPDKKMASDWLAAALPDKGVDADLLLSLAHGAPLAALKWYEEDVLTVRQALCQDLIALAEKRGDPLKAAAKWSDGEPLRLIDFVLSWVMDLQRLQTGGAAVINQDHLSALTKIAEQMTPRTGVSLMVFMQSLRTQIQHGINFNKQLLAETIFVRWMGAVSCS